MEPPKMGLYTNHTIREQVTSWTQPWTILMMLKVQTVAGSPLLNRILMIGATLYSGYREIYKSPMMQELTWSSISQDFGSTANHLKIAPSDSNTLYAAYGENLYKTTNGGSERRLDASNRIFWKH